MNTLYFRCTKTGIKVLFIYLILECCVVDVVIDGRHTLKFFFVKEE